jgi:hypothetical protein
VEGAAGWRLKLGQGVEGWRPRLSQAAEGWRLRLGQGAASWSPHHHCPGRQVVMVMVGQGGSQEVVGMRVGAWHPLAGAGAC